MSGNIGLAQPDRAYPRTEAWKAMEQANSEAMRKMTAALAARNGSGYAEVASQAVGEALEPPVGLAEAKAAHAAAVARVAKVKDALSRAQDRADANERDLARYGAIDDRIERWAVAQAYADEPADQLPLSEQLAMAERARAVERHDLAARALRHVSEELRVAERDEQATDRALRAAASAVLMEQAAFLAREHAGVVAHEQELRQRIKAYGDANLPGLGGATALPHVCIEALNTVREELGRDLEREQALRKEHAKLMAGDD